MGSYFFRIGSEHTVCYEKGSRDVAMMSDFPELTLPVFDNGLGHRPLRSDYCVLLLL